ncbi:MAG: DUF4142 domain-containing protein [Bdellovibrionales bacterium]|nr:DUF4142 domain-containing protein [Ramlibacter sp.]
MYQRTRLLLFPTTVLALALHAIAAPVQAPISPVRVSMPPVAGQAQLATRDRVFIKDAAELGRFKVATSQLAMQQAASPRVSAFASSLVRDRQSADAGLRALSQAKGVTPPMMTGGHRKTLNQLAKAHGAGFDRIYLDKVGLQSHQEGIKVFEKAGAAVKDPQLKAWIDETLPMMRNHLAQAQIVSGRR